MNNYSSVCDTLEMQLTIDEGTMKFDLPYNKESHGSSDEVVFRKNKTLGIRLSRFKIDTIISLQNSRGCWITFHFSEMNEKTRELLKEEGSLGDYARRHFGRPSIHIHTFEGNDYFVRQPRIDSFY